ncbi:hypothetical protein OIO90_002092 [Microbotryomycetes sp. JL221]|nr:hypothetical protein OIO90_002092 [Microbotryomycetes sp. JL221]
MVTTASVDVCISIVYIVGLRSRLSDFQETNSAIRIIIRTCLQSASYTSFVASGAAIIFLLNNTPTFALIDAGWALFLPLPSLYALSLFTTLDMRNQVSRYLTKQRQLKARKDLATKSKRSSILHRSFSKATTQDNASVIDIARPLSARLRRHRDDIDEESVGEIVTWTDDRACLQGVVVNVEFFTTSEKRKSAEDVSDTLL